MDSGPGHFPTAGCWGGADGLRRKPGARDPPAAPFPKVRAQPGQGRGLQAGWGSHDATVTAAGQGAWPWGRLEGKPQQPECHSAGTRGAGRRGCLVATSPQSPAGPLGGTTQLLRAKSSVWR